ncbi:hypothetical protein M1146_05490, partial [Patescibacteria group bacterium]|nr:hypothetical protein [Patescibacteria group bacterium]
LDNLQALRMLLERCVDEGMLDEGESYYNELVDLVSDAEILKTWDELAEIITKAKTIEIDIDTWLSVRGNTTISMQWPSIKAD